MSLFLAWLPSTYSLWRFLFTIFSTPTIVTILGDVWHPQGWHTLPLWPWSATAWNFSSPRPQPLTPMGRAQSLPSLLWNHTLTMLLLKYCLIFPAHLFHYTQCTHSLTTLPYLSDHSLLFIIPLLFSCACFLFRFHGPSLPGNHPQQTWPSHLPSYSPVKTPTCLNTNLPPKSLNTARKMHTGLTWWLLTSRSWFQTPSEPPMAPNSPSTFPDDFAFHYLKPQLRPSLWVLALSSKTSFLWLFHLPPALSVSPFLLDHAHQHINVLPWVLVGNITIFPESLTWL